MNEVMFANDEFFKSMLEEYSHLAEINATVNIIVQSISDSSTQMDNNSQEMES